MTVVEHHDLIHTEDSTCPCDPSGQCCLLVGSFHAGQVSIEQDDIGHSADVETYFAIMLPGSAILSVCARPLVGLKIADGFEVSSCCGAFASG